MKGILVGIWKRVPISLFTAELTLLLAVGPTWAQWYGPWWIPLVMILVWLQFRTLRRYSIENGLWNGNARGIRPPGGGQGREGRWVRARAAERKG